MVKGALISIMMFFGNSDRVIENYLHGYWVVTEDFTDKNRDPWHRIYYFNKCPKNNSNGLCSGEYGWAIDPGIYDNLFDRAYFDYGIVHAEKQIRRIQLNDQTYDFILEPGQRSLKVFNKETDQMVLKLRKIRKAEWNQ